MKGCLLLLTALLVACSADNGNPVFRHDVTGDRQPWTHEGFDAEAQKFTFAVFADITGGERDGVFDIAIAQLNLLRPELILNVGDLIEGESEERAEIDRQWNAFDRSAQQAKAPIFYVGGNHDLSGAFLQSIWDERLGRRYYHFLYRNVLFLVLDTEDNTPARSQEIFELRNAAIVVAETEGWEAFAATEYASIPENRAGNIGPEQAAYFEQVIAANPNVRWTFLLMHKAPWERGEDSGFVRIEAALADRPYTVFHGHEHAYQHRQRHGRDYIQLATTGGVQLPARGRSVDHVTWVTVDGAGVDIANLLLSGILNKLGQIPLDGDAVCFELVECSSDE